MSNWEGPNGPLGEFTRHAVDQIVRAYAARPLLALEAAKIERSNFEGGYGQRQTYELIQNGADTPGGG